MSIGSIAKIGWGYAQRAAKMYPNLVFGTGSEKIGGTLKRSFKGIKYSTNTQATNWLGKAKVDQHGNPIFKKAYKGGKGFKGFGKQLKDALLAGEKEAVAKNAKGFWKNMGNELSTLPKTLGNGWTSAATTAKGAGKGLMGQAWAGSKGFIKSVGTKMPLLGSLMLVAFELPNIFKATKNEGIVTGAGEVAKAGARLGGGMLGAAIGSALLPGVGTLVGWIAGDWLVSKVVGKSYSEKKAKQEAELAEAQAQAQTQGLTPEQIAAMGANGTSDSTNQNATTPNPFGATNQAELLRLQQQLYSANAGFDNKWNDDFMMNTSGLNKLA